MIDISGASGRIKAVLTHLTSYLSSTRCAKIDNLDTTLTSRAPASTALSSAVWTSGTADKINSGGIPGTVKSVQTGYAAFVGAQAGSGEDTNYRDITITAVGSTAKCFVYWVVGETNATLICTARLTSTTNLRISRNSTGGSMPAGRWTVVEHY